MGNTWVADELVLQFVVGLRIGPLPRWNCRHGGRGETHVWQEVDHLSSTNAEIAIRKLAERTRAQFESDFALAVGPVTPAPDSAPSPEPILWLALAHGGGTTCHPTTYAGHPDILQERTAKQALNLLRKYLLNLQRNSA
jgi:hypothetical protein